MRKLAVMSVSAVAMAAACANPDSTPTAPSASAPNFSYELAVPGRAGDTPAHVFLARGLSNAAKPGGGARINNLSYHGGPVKTATTTVTPIYWGTSWASYSGDKITGLKSFYAGLNSSNYAGTNSEYTNSSGTHVSTSYAYNTELYNKNAPPSGAPSTSAVLTVACNAATAAGVVSAEGYYPVYSDQKRGTAGYCAWHSAGTCGGKTIKFAFFFNLDGDAGCNPQDTQTTHSQGLAALANVSGHEISEMVTDPELNAWYDRQGSENSDKCAWTFSGKLVKLGTDSWKVQGNYSNAAANARSGYDGGGCIDGN